MQNVGADADSPALIRTAELDVISVDIYDSCELVEQYLVRDTVLYAECHLGDAVAEHGAKAILKVGHTSRVALICASVSNEASVAALKRVAAGYAGEPLNDAPVIATSMVSDESTARDLPCALSLVVQYSG